MKIIGLVGGVASGKSQVADMFRRLGAEVLDADRAGHEVLTQEPVKAAIRRQFGSGVFDTQGDVDRKRLAQIVFAPPPTGPVELAKLEQITHPEIRRRLVEQIDRATAVGVQAAILDAPVMLKSGWDQICNTIVFVECPEPVRRSRAAGRGWDAAEFEAREQAQESVEEKRRRAEFVIDNSESLEYTQAQIERLWRSLVG